MEETEQIILQDQEISGIFVGCEFEETIRKFKRRFPDKKIYYVDKERFSQSRKYPWDPEQREIYYENKDKRSIALSYIKEMYILSKCDSYVYSECSGSIAVLLLKLGSFDKCVCI